MEEFALRLEDLEKEKEDLEVEYQRKLNGTLGSLKESFGEEREAMKKQLLEREEGEL